MRPALPAGLYGMADAGHGDPVTLGLALAVGGCRVVQLRAKGWSTEQRTEAAAALVTQLQAHEVLVIVNDDVEAARRAGAHGVHLGQADGSVARARRELGPQVLIGRSTHDLDQVAAAQAEGADYLGFGPVFATSTKADHDPVVGLAGLARAVRATTLPVVAIGGITAARLPAVKATSVHAWAVVSDLLRHATGPAGALSRAVRAFR